MGGVSLVPHSSQRNDVEEVPEEVEIRAVHVGHLEDRTDPENIGTLKEIDKSMRFVLRGIEESLTNPIYVC